MSDRQLRARTLAARSQTRAARPRAPSKQTAGRSLRSQLSVQAPQNTSSPIKKEKKQRPPPIRYSCTSCGDDLPSKSLPDENPTSDCKHLINTCTSCLRRWIKVQTDDGNLISVGDSVKNLAVRCPECPELMKNIDVKAAASKQLYKRFDELDRRHTAESTPGWRWCLSPVCNAGQVYEAPADESSAGIWTRLSMAKARQGSGRKVVKCNECNFEVCVTCDRPWHEGETCEEYQARIKDRLDEEDRAIATVLKVTNKCPNCKANIEKNGGCPYMFCTKCRTPFCWNCLSTYTLNTGTCNCNPPLPAHHPGP